MDSIGSPSTARCKVADPSATKRRRLNVDGAAVRTVVRPDTDSPLQSPRSLQDREAIRLPPPSEAGAAAQPQAPVGASTASVIQATLAERARVFLDLALQTSDAASIRRQAQEMPVLLAGQPLGTYIPIPGAVLEALAAAWAVSAFEKHGNGQRLWVLTEGLCGFGRLPAAESQRVACALARAAFLCSSQPRSARKRQAWLDRLCHVQASLASLAMARSPDGACLPELARTLLTWPPSQGGQPDARATMSAPDWGMLATALVRQAPSLTRQWRPEGPALSRQLRHECRSDGPQPSCVEVVVPVQGASGAGPWPIVQVELPTRWPDRVAFANRLARDEVALARLWNAALWYQMHAALSQGGAGLKDTPAFWAVGLQLSVGALLFAEPAALEAGGRDNPGQQVRYFAVQLARWSREPLEVAQAHAILLGRRLGDEAMPDPLRDRLQAAWMAAFGMADSWGQRQALHAMLRLFLAHAKPGVALGLASYREALLPSQVQGPGGAEPRLLPRVGAAGVLAAAASPDAAALVAVFDAVQARLAARIDAGSLRQARLECSADVAACCGDVLLRCAELGLGERACAALLASIRRQPLDSPALPGALRAIRAWVWREGAPADALSSLLELATRSDAAAQDLLPEVLGESAGAPAWARILRSTAKLPIAALLRLLRRLEDRDCLVGAVEACGLSGYERQRLAPAWLVAAAGRAVVPPATAPGEADPLQELRDGLAALYRPERLLACAPAARGAGRLDDLLDLLRLLWEQPGRRSSDQAKAYLQGVMTLPPECLLLADCQRLASIALDSPASSVGAADARPAALPATAPADPASTGMSGPQPEPPDTPALPS